MALYRLITSGPGTVMALYRLITSGPGTVMALYRLITSGPGTVMALYRLITAGPGTLQYGATPLRWASHGATQTAEPAHCLPQYSKWCETLSHIFFFPKQGKSLLLKLVAGKKILKKQMPVGANQHLKGRTRGRSRSAVTARHDTYCVHFVR